MKNIRRKSNEEAWDNRELGSSEEHVHKASPDREKYLMNGWAYEQFLYGYRKV